MIKNDIPQLLNHIDKYKSHLAHNEILFNIYEGDLLSYLKADLASQFSPESFEMIQHRICPINVLIRIIDKLSKIYQQSPIRIIVDGKDNDQELLSWYEEQFKINQKFNIYNEFFNLHKGALAEPYLSKNNKPSIRIIPYDRFLPYSNNKVDPTVPTHIIVNYGTVKKQINKKESIDINVYAAYTDSEFVIFDEDGLISKEEMIQIGNPEGVNVFERIPYIYVNKSHNLLIPKQDTDTLKLTKVLPILLSDLNYAVMFQAFSIIYGINVNDENVKMAPHAFWRLTSVGDGEQKPEIGVIKPQIEIDAVLNLVQSEFSFWLNTKGIKPGSIGQASMENFSSGISKMIDEMDITEARIKQVEAFTDAEEEFWDLLINHVHPYWRTLGLIDSNLDWTPGVKIKTIFAEQIPMYNRGQLVKDLKEEVSAGFTTKKIAIRKLNPNLKNEEIDDLISQIDDERGYIEEEEKEEINLEEGEGKENANEMAEDKD